MWDHDNAINQYATETLRKILIKKLNSSYGLRVDLRQLRICHGDNAISVDFMYMYPNIERYPVSRVDPRWVEIFIPGLEYTPRDDYVYIGKELNWKTVTTAGGFHDMITESGVLLWKKEPQKEYALRRLMCNHSNVVTAGGSFADFSLSNINGDGVIPLSFSYNKPLESRCMVIKWSNFTTYGYTPSVFDRTKAILPLFYYSQESLKKKYIIIEDNRSVFVGKNEINPIVICSGNTTSFTYNQETDGIDNMMESEFDEIMKFQD